jgi:hypothetical protein
MKALLLALAVSPMFAQDVLVSGHVRHSSGLAVPGARVSLVDDRNGTRRSAVADHAGYYSIAGLEPGVYDMTVRRAGFQTTTRMDIQLVARGATRIDFIIEIATVRESVRVEGAPTLASTGASSLSTNLRRDFFPSLPLGGRGMMALLEAAPGVLITPAGSVLGESGQFSMNGQRATANRIMVDGIAVDSGPAYSLGPDPGASGVTPALTVTGSMQNIAGAEAVEEFEVQTSGADPGTGRGSGAHVSITTRSGTNELHGGFFEFVRNDKLNAGDWFQNRLGMQRADLRLNNFGGTLGGPVLRNRSFYFFSYEGLRLDQPETQTTLVPSLYARLLASPRAAGFLDSFPTPNGPGVGFSLAGYTANVPNIAGVDTASLRVDHTFDSRTRLFARFNHSPSARYSPGLINSSAIGLADDSVHGGLSVQWGAWANDLRGSYSVERARVASARNASLDTASIGVASYVPVPLGSDSGYSVTLLDLGTGMPETFALRRRQSQQSLTEMLTLAAGRHELRFGGEYRRLIAGFAQNPLSARVYYADSDAIESGDIAQLTITRSTPVSAALRDASVFIADTWQLTPRVIVTSGLRWELQPPPAAVGGPTLLTLTGWPAASNLGFAPPGTPLWRTGYHDFAPRGGVAVRLDDPGSWVLRSSAGIFYDSAVSLSLNNLTALPPYAAASNYYDVSAFSPPAALAPGSGDPVRVAAFGYTPDFRSPRSFQWNVELQGRLSAETLASVTYAGSASAALLRPEYVALDTGLYHEVQFATEITNAAHSSYEALQTQLRHRSSIGLEAIFSYAWDHSIDNASRDAALLAALPGTNARADRGNSNFDVRHSFSGLFSFHPRPLRSLTISGIVRARTGFPVDVGSYVVYRGAVPYGSYQLTERPDYTGAPVWLADANAGGGRRLNPNAFSQSLGPGSLGRNAISGFGMYQADLTLSREFQPRDGLRIELRAEAYNLTNHPNFANPVCCSSLISAPALGQSQRMLAGGLGSGSPADGLDPIFQIGGPRSIQLGLRVRF